MSGQLSDDPLGAKRLKQEEEDAFVVVSLTKEPEKQEPQKQEMKLEQKAIQNPYPMNSRKTNFPFVSPLMT